MVVILVRFGVEDGDSVRVSLKGTVKGRVRIMAQDCEKGCSFMIGVRVRVGLGCGRSSGQKRETVTDPGPNSQPNPKINPNS